MSRPLTRPPSQPPLVIAFLPLLLLLLLPASLVGASIWVECASSICVECHDAAAPAPLKMFRWFSTGWYDCQPGSALSYTDYCRQQPQPFNQTPPFSSIFSAEKEMAFGDDGGDPDHPFLVRIPFKPTNPMAAAAANVSSPSSTALQYTAPTPVHDIIPMKFTLPMCFPPFPQKSSVSSGKIGMSAPEGAFGLWLYIVDKRGLTFAGAISNATAPRRSPLSQMVTISASDAFTAKSGCKYVYAVLYVAHPSSPAAVDVSFDWLPQAGVDFGSILSYSYLSAEKFEFDPARVEGKYSSLQPLCAPQTCDGKDALFDIVIDGLGGATLSLVMAPIGDVSSTNGIRMISLGGDGYRIGNVLEFPTSLFGGGSSNLMVTITGIGPVRQQLPIRLLSNFGADLVAGVETTDVWAEFAYDDVSNNVSGITISMSPQQFFSVSPRVATSVCPSNISPSKLTMLANLAVGPALSIFSFQNCRRVCGVADAVSGLASVLSSGADRCGTPVFVPKDIANMVCRQGYWLSAGTQQRICLDDYSFSGSASVCSPFQCPALDAPLHGFLLPSPTWKGEFSCSVHWKISGTRTLTCLSSGQWDKPAPTCLRASCSPAIPPEHGRITVFPSFNLSDGNSTLYSVSYPQATQVILSGTLLKLSCDAGFYLVGNGFILCEPNELYNSSLGACLPNPCRSFSTLNLPPRTFATPSSIRFLEISVITCESGYRFENGSAEINAWCDIYGNISLDAQVPNCIRIPNFCEKNPWACGVIAGWPVVLCLLAALWFYFIQKVLVIIVLPSTGDQIMLRCTRFEPLNMLPALVRKKWSLLPDEFILRIANCTIHDDVVYACRNLTQDSIELSDQQLLRRLFELKLPHLKDFWDRQPRLVLCICQREASDRVFVKRNHSSLGDDQNAKLQSESLDAVRRNSSIADHRWRHIHSNSLMSIAASGPLPLPPERAAKIFSWMQSKQPAWECQEMSVAWKTTLRKDASLWGQKENSKDEAVEEIDLNRWVSKSIKRFNAVELIAYEISVVTGKEFGAGTDSRVHCILFNEEGLRSEELPLLTSLQNSDPFETGNTDTFRHVIPSLGRVTSVRIRYDATGFGADWLLDTVRVKDVSTGEVTTFEHGGWLSENMTSVLLQARQCSPAFPYEIAVFTGTTSGAGTDSQVYCTLFGNVCVGNSGELPLITSLENSDPFETGATDTFIHILPRSLGQIKSICIRHDASGLGSDWLLNRVTVKDLTKGEITEFDYGKWLTKENHSILLFAVEMPVICERCFVYEISVDTGVDRGSGTDSQVYCLLYDDEGNHSEEFILSRSLNHSDAFEAGNTDTFRLITPRPLGRITDVRIRHYPKGAGSDWKLERLRVRDVSKGVTLEYDHCDWLTSKKTDVLLQLKHGLPRFQYKITVVTGKELGAGTDAQVFCTICGESWASSGELALVSSLDHQNAFETGNTDTFKYMLPRSLGRILSIRIRFDAAGFGSDWLLERVFVTDVSSGEITEFEHCSWLTRDCKEVILIPKSNLLLPGSVEHFHEAIGDIENEAKSIKEEDAIEDSGLPHGSVEVPSRIDRSKRAQDMLLRMGFSIKQ